MEVNYDFAGDNYWYCGVGHRCVHYLGKRVMCLGILTSSVIYIYSPSPAAVFKTNAS